MTKSSTAAAHQELQAMLEAADSDAPSSSVVLQPPSALAASQSPIINSPATEAPTLSPIGNLNDLAERNPRGLTGVEFVCPVCSSRRWGTIGLFGVCHRLSVDELGGGWRVTERCSFEWLRSDDWTVFRIVGSGRPFESREAFEAFVEARRP